MKFLWLVLAALSLSLNAQQAAPPAASSSTVPRLVNFSGKASDAQGKAVTGVVGITFAIYQDQSEGAPLWLETQNAQIDAKGNYTVQLGATKPEGLPLDLFSSGEARWLGIRVNGGEEQPRVLLLSVPYALKAADAETIGGLPPSAFVLAAPPLDSTAPNANATPQTSVPPPAGSAVTGTGSANYLPLWDSASDIISSVLYQTGSGTTAKIGIGTITPASTLDIKGGNTVRGILSLPATGAATATAGKNSQPLAFTASAFNSGTATAVNQVFRWQAEPVGNNTATTSGLLDLLYATGSATPASTGLKIGSNGQITFVAGQTFPGTSTGTVTSVASGLGLTGGPITASGTLAIDPAVVPQLNVANTFTGSQTVNGNLSATGMVTGSGYQIGTSLFVFGSASTGNSFLGFAGNTTTTAAYNTGSGFAALQGNTTGDGNTATGFNALQGDSSGGDNTASGFVALYNNSTGSSNTASGSDALLYNTTGSSNTAFGTYAGFTLDNSSITASGNTFLGEQSGMSTGTLTNATAVGANAEVAASNAMVLGSINGVNGASANTKVGIGITAPQFTLDLHGGILHVGGNVPQTHSAEGVYLDWNALTGTTGETDFVNNQGGGNGGFAFMNTLSSGTPVSTLMFIAGSGKVGIGTTAPDSLLTVNGSADKPSGGSWGTYSDGRLKTLHGNYTAGLSEIMKLHPVRYRYKEQNAMNIRDHDEHVGFVAQDVQRVIPEAVTTNSSGYLLVNNDPILWTMLNAIKEQQREFQQQQAVLRTQAAAIHDLKSELRATRQTLRKVNALLMAAQPTLRAAK